MKTRFGLSAVLLLSGTLAACGSGGGSMASTSAGASGVISGKLSGDLSNVSAIEAVRVNDGVKYTGSISPSSAKVNALTSAVSNFTLRVPAGDSYTINITGANNQTLATIQFPADAAGTATTTTLNVPTPLTTPDTEIDMGTVTVPAGAGSAGTPTTVIPTVNPLAQIDFDHDGLHDLDDADDDNNGIDDVNDDVNHHSINHVNDDPNHDLNDDLNHDPNDNQSGGTETHGASHISRTRK